MKGKTLIKHAFRAEKRVRVKVNEWILNDKMNEGVFHFIVIIITRNIVVGSSLLMYNVIQFCFINIPFRLYIYSFNKIFHFLMTNYCKLLRRRITIKRKL